MSTGSTRSSLAACRSSCRCCPTWKGASSFPHPRAAQTTCRARCDTRARLHMLAKTWLTGLTQVEAQCIMQGTLHVSFPPHSFSPPLPPLPARPAPPHPVQPCSRSLWWASAVGALMSLGYSTLAVSLGASQASNHLGTIAGRVAPPVDKAFGIANSLGTIAFAYSSAVVLMEVQDTLREPPKASVSMKKSLNLG